MSFAPDYNPTKDFSQAEANNEAGRSTVSTSALDTEFANLASSVNSLNTNLKLLQRDDGQVKDFTVGTYALSNQLRALISVGGSIPRGPWVTATAYAISDLVSSSGIAYICHTAHTSGASFDATKFIDISGDGSAAVSAANAAASANAAGISEAAAAVSAAAALVSQGAAATSASAASTSAAAASTSETTASSAASSATASAGQASSSAAAAIAAQAAAELATLPGRLVDIQVYSTAGAFTWNKPSGLTVSSYTEVEESGSGGAGGGAEATTAGNISIGSPGGAASYIKARILTSLLDATATVTVAAGVSGVSGLAGNDGNSSSFVSNTQSLVAAGGKGGGVVAAGSAFTANTASGSSSATASANWAVIEQMIGRSAYGVVLSGAAYIPADGASSRYGRGGLPAIVTGVGSSPGSAAVNIGAGGGPAASKDSGSAQAGGVTVAGIVIVRTYS